MNDEVRHPDITVQLTGADGNAFAVMGKIQQALKRAGSGPAELRAFTDEAMAGDYDRLLQTCMRWVTVQ